LNAKEHVFDLDFDSVYSSILFTGAKKRYAGKLIWIDGKEVNKMKIVGFDSVRSDVTKIGKKLQEDLFMIMTSNKKKEVIREEVFNYVRTEILNIRNKKYKVEDIAFPTSISKPASEYKVKTMGVRASENSMMIGKSYKPGDKPLLVFLKKIPHGYPPMDVILIDEEKDLPVGFEVDYDRMIDKSIRMKVEDIIEQVGLSFDEITTGKKQSTLW
jgi:DNA polymerase elongation subunit (family B)